MNTCALAIGAPCGSRTWPTTAPVLGGWVIGAAATLVRISRNRRRKPGICRLEEEPGRRMGRSECRGLRWTAEGWRRCPLEMQQQKGLAQQVLNPPINLLALPERNV